MAVSTKHMTAADFGDHDREWTEHLLSLDADEADQEDIEEVQDLYQFALDDGLPVLAEALSTWLSQCDERPD